MVLWLHTTSNVFALWLLQVLMASIFDLLFSQCDRHGQNLYLKPDGSLVLIDNDQVGDKILPGQAAAASCQLRQT